MKIELVDIIHLIQRCFYVDTADVERMGTKELKDSDYCNEEEYKSFLDELSTFKYVAVNKDTRNEKSLNV